jgi:pimeloyl-ACP methyl ester carboxylesterase
MSAAEATMMVESSRPSACAPAAPARALVFDGCLGLLHDAPGRTGVLMCSPWGYEELCARKSWRLLAEAIAAVGAPCLRFDYPGAGDSLDVAGVDLESWIASAEAAARALRAETGVERLVLVGQGMGGLVARLAARGIDEVAGLALLAPVVSGRMHLRELAMWGAMVATSIKLPAGLDEDIGVAGFVLPAGVATAIKRIDLMAEAGAAPGEVLIAAPPSHPQDEALAARLEGEGASVRRLAYDGYEALLADPTTAVAPLGVIEAVAGWIGERFDLSFRPYTDKVIAPAESVVEFKGAGFIEAPVRFSGDAGLFGVLCRPAGPQRGRTVLMLNSGYDPHTGWARTWVEQARALAAEGVASLRMDASGVGDSPAREGAPDQVLYSDIQADDVADAVDWLEGQGLGPVVLAGRCSGAYLGLRAAVADARVAGLVMVNPLRLVWRPGETVDAAIRSASLSHYRARALQPETLGRILRGEVDVGRLTLQVFRREFARLTAGSRAHSALRGEVHARFAALRQRGVPVSLLYSDGDDGLIELAAYFGKDGKDLADFANVTRINVPGADHNLTPPSARARLFAAILDAATA